MEDRKVVSRLSQEMCMIFRQFSPCCFMKFERLCFNRFHKFRRVYATILCIGLECLDDCMSLVSLLVSMEVQPLQIRVHISATTTILSCPGRKKVAVVGCVLILSLHAVQPYVHLCGFAFNFVAGSFHFVYSVFKHLVRCGVSKIYQMLLRRMHVGVAKADLGCGSQCKCT